MTELRFEIRVRDRAPILGQRELRPGAIRIALERPPGPLEQVRAERRIPMAGTRDFPFLTRKKHAIMNADICRRCRAKRWKQAEL